MKRWILAAVLMMPVFSAALPAPQQIGIDFQHSRVKLELALESGTPVMNFDLGPGHTGKIKLSQKNYEYLNRKLRALGAQSLHAPSVCEQNKIWSQVNIAGKTVTRSFCARDKSSAAKQLRALIGSFRILL